MLVHCWPQAHSIRSRVTVGLGCGVVHLRISIRFVLVQVCILPILTPIFFAHFYIVESLLLGINSLWLNRPNLVISREVKQIWMNRPIRSELLEHHSLQSGGYIIYPISVKKNQPDICSCPSSEVKFKEVID